MTIIPIVVTTKNNTSVYAFGIKGDCSKAQLLDTIKDITKKYLATRDGKQILDNNNGKFTLNDFVKYVPTELCDEHKIYIIHSDTNAVRIQLRKNILDIKSTSWDN